MSELLYESTTGLQILFDNDSLSGSCFAARRTSYLSGLAHLIKGFERPSSQCNVSSAISKALLCNKLLWQKGPLYVLFPPWKQYPPLILVLWILWMHWTLVFRTIILISSLWSHLGLWCRQIPLQSWERNWWCQYQSQDPLQHQVPVILQEIPTTVYKSASSSWCQILRTHWWRYHPCPALSAFLYNHKLMVFIIISRWSKSCLQACI